jgi:hypothetical protein
MTTTHWFVYYKVAAADAPACVSAARAVQAQLRTRHVGLQAMLLRRPTEGSDGCVTLMETYSGLDADVLAEVEAHAQAALKHWTVGARHCERFVPCA